MSRQAWSEHKHTYQIKPSHAVSRLTVLHVEEEEDVNSSQNKIEEPPSACWPYDICLLGHHPKSCSQPVDTWNRHSPLMLFLFFWYTVTVMDAHIKQGQSFKQFFYCSFCVMSKTEAIPSCPQLAVKTHRWPRGSTVWRYVWRAWEWQTWIPTYWPAERETIRVPKTQAKQQNTCLWHAKHRCSSITDTVGYYVVNTACCESC